MKSVKYALIHELIYHICTFIINILSAKVLNMVLYTVHNPRCNIQYTKHVLINNKIIKPLFKSRMTQNK